MLETNVTVTKGPSRSSRLRSKETITAALLYRRWNKKGKPKRREEYPRFYKGYPVADGHIYMATGYARCVKVPVPKRRELSPGEIHEA